MRESTREKLFFVSRHLFPRFSILDPETTYTLPLRQTANGIVDAFVHTLEQYLTYPADAPSQDRQAEAILLTLIEEGPKALAWPLRCYAVRANPMWVRDASAEPAYRLRRAAGLGLAYDRTRADGALRHRSRAIAGRRVARCCATSASGFVPSCSNTPSAFGISYG